MIKATKKKFWKNFAATSLVASLLGVIINTMVGDQWTAVAFMACTISSGIILAEQIYDEQEDNNDEQ